MRTIFETRRPKLREERGVSGLRKSLGLALSILKPAQITTINFLLPSGRIMDDGPVMVIGFNADCTICVRNQEGKVVEGEPNEVTRQTHIWALLR